MRIRSDRTGPLLAAAASRRAGRRWAGRRWVGRRWAGRRCQNVAAQTFAISLGPAARAVIVKTAISQRASDGSAISAKVSNTRYDMLHHRDEHGGIKSADGQERSLNPVGITHCERRSKLPGAQRSRREPNDPWKEAVSGEGARGHADEGRPCSPSCRVLCLSLEYHRESRVLSESLDSQSLVDQGGIRRDRARPRVPSRH